ncbi:uncharacterized protein LOC123489882 isoform X2 [Coregonus clupeaformis]|uniref:uncharacterized protein LOC123489882 isoform X2 n=1 Tax=Coregonus clupeaformis TaxID=59861 RepID=UPI001E1C2B9A|nr:uncharacterized protein LOC123489882 isoform X2 [Coregonus clupeaformis]
MENKEFKAAVVTFTTVTHKDETSQTSLTLSRGKRSYPDLHTFVQDMKDDHWNLLSENMRAGIELSDSPSSSGSGSNEAGEVTSLGRSVRFSCSGGPSRCTSARTTCSTRTPTPFPSSHRCLTSLLSEDKERYVSSPEGGDREMRHRPHSAPLRSVFGISEDSVFDMVQSGQSQGDIVPLPKRSRQEKYRPSKMSTDGKFMMGFVELVINLLNSRLAELM